MPIAPVRLGHGGRGAAGVGRRPREVREAAIGRKEFVEACGRPLRGALLALTELGDMPWVAWNCSGQSPNANAPVSHELTKRLTE
ncbi:hypothetical protein GCM10010402_71620 [Actinomadura luteofluorescens]